MYNIPKNLVPNVDLSYDMDLWTLGSKLHKNSFSNDLEGHFKVMTCPLRSLDKQLSNFLMKVILTSIWISNLHKR